MSVVQQPVARAKQLSKARLATDFSLDFSISPEGKVTVPIVWESRSLVSLKLPIPTKITTSIRLHRLAAPVFELWFRSWDREACEALKAFGGSYNPRLMRMSKNLPATDSPTRDWAPYLSRHSRGLAVDFNHTFALNKQGQNGVPPGEEGSLHHILDLARRVRVPMVSPNGESWEAGLVCGIDWSPKFRDPMHVELGSF